MSVRNSESFWRKSKSWKQLSRRSWHMIWWCRHTVCSGQSDLVFWNHFCRILGKRRKSTFCLFHQNTLPVQALGSLGITFAFYPPSGIRADVAQCSTDSNWARAFSFYTAGAALTFTSKTPQRSFRRNQGQICQNYGQSHTANTTGPPDFDLSELQKTYRDALLAQLFCGGRQKTLKSMFTI